MIGPNISNLTLVSFGSERTSCREASFFIAVWSLTLILKPLNIGDEMTREIEWRMPASFRWEITFARF